MTLLECYIHNSLYSLQLNKQLFIIGFWERKLLPATLQNDHRLLSAAPNIFPRTIKTTLIN